MVLVLTAAEPLGGCLVGAASCSDVLVTATDGQVACYAAPRPAAATSVSGLSTSAACPTDPALPCRLWQHHITGGRVEHAAPLAADGSAYLVVTTHSGAAPPRAAVVMVGGPGMAPSLAAQVELSSGGAEDGTGPYEEVPAHPTFSNLARCPHGRAKDAGFLLAASLWQGTVHLVQAERAAGGSWKLSAAATRLCNLVTMEPGKWAQQGCAARQQRPRYNAALNTVRSMRAASTRLVG